MDVGGYVRASRSALLHLESSNTSEAPKGGRAVVVLVANYYNLHNYESIGLTLLLARSTENVTQDWISK